MLYYGATDVLRYLLNLLPEDPGVEWKVAMVIMTTLSIVMLLPIWPPCVMAMGLLFGFWEGMCLSFAAIYSAAILSFVLGQCFLQEPVRDCVDRGKYSNVKRMMRVLEDEDDSLKFMILFRFLFMPMFIRNYGPSTLNIPFWKLCVAAIPHSIWISILFASLGATFKDTAQLLRNGGEMSFKDLSWQQGLIFIVALLVAIGLAIYAHNKYLERLEQDEAADLLAQGNARPVTPAVRA